MPASGADDCGCSRGYGGRRNAIVEVVGASEVVFDEVALEKEESGGL